MRNFKDMTLQEIAEWQETNREKMAEQRQKFEEKKQGTKRAFRRYVLLKEAIPEVDIEDEEAFLKRLEKWKKQD